MMQFYTFSFVFCFPESFPGYVTRREEDGVGGGVLWGEGSRSPQRNLSV
jgi:hypothetical protein